MMELATNAILGLFSLLFFMWGAIFFCLSILSERFRHKMTATLGTVSVSVAMLITLAIG
ncbi:hypothetical protein [Pleionea sediminis]|uniref:hypothetical protein n=1 Tax=Pleionea sediminis TaxID=2569479 RepID=UPI0013DDD5EC|nr:hypothetical protein [Pleionea sediminis]